ncbi:transglutaminase family protein [Mariniluteicoccus flavus]
MARPTLKISDRYTIATVFAVILAAFTLKPFTVDWSYLVLSVILVIALGAVGVVLRRLRLGEGLVLGVSLLVLLGFVFAVSLGVGGGESANILSRFLDLFRGAIDHMRTMAAPMPEHPGVRMLFVTAVGIIFIVTDMMVQGIDRPVWALAPLSFLFLGPALGLRDDVGILNFVLIGVGYLAILLAEGINTAERWPRGVRRSSADLSAGPLAWRLAGLVAVPAVILTMLLGSAVPILTSQGWGLTKPKGHDGPLTLQDPTLDLRRNLNQPENRTVITYRTDQPSGAYLRMASLPVFSNAGWQNAAMQLTGGTDLPPAPGVKTTATQKVRRTQIQVSDFRAEYLPLPFATDSFDARGEWSYDRDSLVVLATGADRMQQLSGLGYSVTSYDIEPDGPGLASAPAGNPPDAQLTMPIPQDLPDSLINKTLELTNNQSTPALKAAAIQAYLRSSEFQYSTEPQPGSGYQAIENFLFRDKKGYCEQFATSMAMMARIAGIPSRVSVGFLPGQRNGDQYEVQIRDMHAWPELWFDGYGWVRFEPTPSVASPPAWTVTSNTGSSNNPGASPSPAPAETVAPSQEPTPTPEPEPSQVPVPPAEPGFPWKRAGLAALLVALAAALAAAPMLVRSRRRDARLADGGEPAERVERAWAEVKDTVIDHGGRWPAGSPRVIGAVLAHDLDPTSAKSMRVLALQVERARYARSLELNTDLAALTDQVRAGVIDQAEPGDRLLATWWPKSLWARLFGKL